MADEIFKGPISKWRKFLQSNIEIRDLPKRLYDKRVLTSQREAKILTILSRKGTKRAWNKLLKYIDQCGDYGPKCFIEVLREMNNHNSNWVADQMVEKRQHSDGGLLSKIWGVFSKPSQPTSPYAAHINHPETVYAESSESEDTSEEEEETPVPLNDDIKNIMETIEKLKEELYTNLYVATRKSERLVQGDKEELLKGLEYQLTLLIDGHSSSIQSFAMKSLVKTKAKLGTKRKVDLQHARRKQEIENIVKELEEIIEIYRSNRLGRPIRARNVQSGNDFVPTSFSTSRVQPKKAKLDTKTKCKLQKSLDEGDLETMEILLQSLNINAGNVAKSPPPNRKTPNRCK